jgi:hypothetical protein
VNLLLLSWENPSEPSRQGTALARRVKQVLDGLCQYDCSITLVHYDHNNEVLDGHYYYNFNTINQASVHRYAVSAQINEDKNSVIRKLKTLCYSLTIGDRSGIWGVRSFRLLRNKITKPDLILSFFTPRGPILLGFLFSKYFKSKWQVDFQDEFDHGLSSYLRWSTKLWTTQILKKAKLLTHVSPEWARRDGILLKKEFKVVRHAVNFNTPVLSLTKDNLDYTILYYGSLDFVKQNPSVFFAAFNSINSEAHSNIIFSYAGQKSVFDTFLTYVEDTRKIKYLGWLNQEKLYEEINKSDCLLLLPWSAPGRQVVPSKMYEYASFSKPVLITGDDTGSMISLLKEWHHPNVVLRDADKVKCALKAILEGDDSRFFSKTKCKNVMTENQLIVNLLATETYHYLSK